MNIAPIAARFNSSRMQLTDFTIRWLGSSQSNHGNGSIASNHPPSPFSTNKPPTIYPLVEHTFSLFISVYLKMFIM